MDNQNTQSTLTTVQSSGRAIREVKERFEWVRVTIERDYQMGKMDRAVRDRCFAISARNEASEIAPHRSALMVSERVLSEGNQTQPKGE